MYDNFDKYILVEGTGGAYGALGSIGFLCYKQNGSSGAEKPMAPSEPAVCRKNLEIEVRAPSGAAYCNFGIMTNLPYTQ